MNIFKKLLPTFLSVAVLGYVIYFVTPPKNWAEASISQILIFFLPLLSFFTFFTNLFLNNLARSFSLGLGLMVLIVLYSINQFNPVTAGITLILAILLLVFFKFPKVRTQRNGLTSNIKIPKLSRLRSSRSKRL